MRRATWVQQMISMAEIKMRAAHSDWLKAKMAWSDALTAINVAKKEWEDAQAEFYGTVLTQAAGCGGCTGCSTGKGC